MTTLVAAAAAVASCSFLSPQLVRLVRSGEVGGLSPTMAVVGGLSCTGWTAYGVLAGRWPVIVASVIGAAEYVGFAALLYRARSLHPHAPTSGSVVAAATVIGWSVATARRRRDRDRCVGPADINW